ncbi:unnamed protein product [Caenorhabditis auriculariae]|uniref:BUB1 N-terminal domain-containing protein n=1 Tax=Caenorhabditis auriculariae TaxID=2777116 RepID=A0A8S1GTW2_9PELO|nr:unnamed protein product [Caenorhabditis auriculariae]
MENAQGDQNRASKSDYVFSLSPRPEQEDENDWERYSENMRPTRRGRRVEALQRVETVVDEDEARRKLEEVLENSTVEGCDALNLALEFCTWFENHFTIGHHRLYYQFLWKIVAQPGFIEKYREDERMLKIWEKLADNSGGHARDIYHYAVSHKSLIRCASMYVRWSQCNELAGARVEARRVLLLAKTNAAVPLEAINDAEDALEMREMRREMEERSDGEEDDLEEHRVAFTQLTTIGDGPEVPIVRLPSIAADPHQKSLKLNSARKNSPKIQGNLHPFEVCDRANADDDNYLMSVHDLNVHIERYGIKDTVNTRINQDPSTSTSTKIKPIPSGTSYEVWTLDDKENVPPGGLGPKKPRIVIKQVFKQMSFEEYMAQNVAAGLERFVGRINFDEDI